MASIIIRDGFTMAGAIPARGPYPALNFRYRPALPEDVYEFLEAKKNTGKARLAATVALIHKYLISWDVVDDAGEQVVAKPEVLRVVPQWYLEKIIDRVCGYTVEDESADLKN